MEKMLEVNVVCYYGNEMQDYQEYLHEYYESLNSDIPLDMPLPPEGYIARYSLLPSNIKSFAESFSLEEYKPSRKKPVFNQTEVELTDGTTLNVDMAYDTFKKLLEKHNSPYHFVAGYDPYKVDSNYYNQIWDVSEPSKGDSMA